MLEQLNATSIAHTNHVTFTVANVSLLMTELSFCCFCKLKIYYVLVNSICMIDSLVEKSMINNVFYRVGTQIKIHLKSEKKLSKKSLILLCDKIIL